MPLVMDQQYECRADVFDDPAAYSLSPHGRNVVCRGSRLVRGLGIPDAGLPFVPSLRLAGSLDLGSVFGRRCATGPLGPGEAFHPGTGSWFAAWATHSDGAVAL